MYNYRLIYILKSNNHIFIFSYLFVYNRIKLNLRLNTYLTILLYDFNFLMSISFPLNNINKQITFTVLYFHMLLEYIQIA